MNERILSDDEIAALRSLWATAPTIRDAAGRLGIGIETAMTWAKKLGLTRPVRSDWSDERVEILKSLIRSGYSGSRIAARLGVTRSAVLGKASRLGLAIGVSRPRIPGLSVSDSRKPNRTPVVKAKRSPVIRGPVLERTTNPLPEIDDIARVKFPELEPHHCRFPVGDPRKPEFGFCGLDRIPRSAYCGHHHSRTHTPVPVRMRPAPVIAPSEKVDA